MWSLGVRLSLQTDANPIKGMIMWEVGGIRLETSSSCLGSIKTIMGLNVLVYAWTTEGYGFIELEISNSVISTAFRQPLIMPLMPNDQPDIDPNATCDAADLRVPSPSSHGTASLLRNLYVLGRVQHSHLQYNELELTTPCLDSGFRRIWLHISVPRGRVPSLKFRANQS